MPKPRTEWFAVYYQTGGADNFQWKRSADVAGREDAQTAVAGLRKAGYPAHYDKRELVESIGLPETYEEAGQDPFISPVCKSESA